MPRNESLRRDLLEMAALDRVTRAELAASGSLFDAGYEPGWPASMRGTRNACGG